MIKKINQFAFLVMSSFLAACDSKQAADAIYINGLVYTVDSAFTSAQAFAVKDGKFVAVGSNEAIEAQYAAPEIINLQGMPVYPGFIDAHCHFYGYGLGLQTVDLTNCKTFKEMVERVVAFKRTDEKAWIVGRGWDQNLWAGKEFPSKDTLDKLFPNTPVLLERVDGHAALVNQQALNLAGITANTQLVGGLVELKAGKPTGILVDNAVELATKVIPMKTEKEMNTALLQAQSNCFAVGLTTVDDAGLDKAVVNRMDKLQQDGKLKMRIYAMLNPTQENKEYYFKRGPYKSDRLHVRSFKVYADGALGSRGACLLKSYTDKANHMGFLLHQPLYFDTIAKECNEHGFQMNTHCIGDSANRYLLKTYAAVLTEKNDKRWRIEHAQVVNEADMIAFGKYAVIPSVQPTHATSDMYWAKERLSDARVKGAYAYKQLLEQNNLLAAGSDFPVEHINPLYGFYAAVARKDANGFPTQGFQMENALTREQALRAATIWAAYANFEDTEKGSIEVGKVADFVILEKDIMKIPIRESRDTKVKATYLNGEKVY